MKIRKGDKVIVIVGKDKGVKSVVIKALPKKNKVVVENVNLKVKYIKEGGESKKIRIEYPIDASNVMILDDKGSPTRVGYKFIKGKKVRYAKTTNNEI